MYDVNYTCIHVVILHEGSPHDVQTSVYSSSYISLSTIVLNSRDWSEIVWLPKISHLKIDLAIGFIRRKPAGMHWLGYNDAVSWLNEAKTMIVGYW